MVVKKAIVLLAILTDSETNIELFDKGNLFLCKKGVLLIENFNPIHLVYEREQILWKRECNVFILH